MRNKKTTPAGPRILIIKLSSLGDLFHALPAVHQLKTGLKASIDWVTQNEYAGLVRCFTDVDRVIGFSRTRFWREFPFFFQQLRLRRYDYIIDMQGLLKSALVARLARGRRRIAPSFSREGSHLFFNDKAGGENKKRHAVEECLDVVRYFKLDVQPAEFHCVFPRRPLEQKQKRIALIPCSRWPTKNWAPDRFVEVAKALQEKTGAAIFLVGSAANQDVCHSIGQMLPGLVVNTCGRTNLVEMGSLIQEMDLVISVDSGPMHLAAAIGKPLIAVFGATDPVRTGPYLQLHNVVSTTGLSCQPCRAKKCSREDIACLRDLPGQQVIQKALVLLHCS
ncbi:MAG: glycosyltransferase family 9 protein [Lentisphaerota bacterium]